MTLLSPFSILAALLSKRRGAAVAPPGACQGGRHGGARALCNYHYGKRRNFITLAMYAQDQLRGLLLDHGPSPEVASLIAQERNCLDLSSILEETFRRRDLGPRDLVCHEGAYVSLEVEFLLKHGGLFDPRNVNKLLEDTYRYIELGPLEFKRREGACLSPEIEFLFTQGASFRKVPYGLSRLIQATTRYLQQSDQNKADFLFQHQEATHNRIHPGWYTFLFYVYESLVKSVDSETLCHIVEFFSTQREEVKIYTTLFKTNGLCWPLVTFNDKDNNWLPGLCPRQSRPMPAPRLLLMNASIVELGQRSDKVTIRAQGSEFRACKLVLKARSSYFEKWADDNPEALLFDYEGLCETIRFVVIYAHSERTDRSLWDEFAPHDNRDTNENTLDELINIIYAADMFEMADLFGAVEQHIAIHGKSFIYPKNAQEIKFIAKEVNAMTLERYCDAFIATNLRTFTLFPSLPVELQMNIWRQMASQPQLVLAQRLGRDSGIRKLETPPHIARILKVCRDSNAEIQQFWGRPSLDGINFKFDIIWLDSHFFPLSIDIKEARYCASPAPYPSLGSEWELEVDKIIRCCPHMKVLYLETKVLSEIEYCLKFINKEPTTLVEARRWMEESAHQRVQQVRRDLPDGSTLPRIMVIDEYEIARSGEDTREAVLLYQSSAGVQSPRGATLRGTAAEHHPIHDNGAMQQETEWKQALRG
ncbi:hypothetical protein V501_01618 [Pseudogymnoascus sp. VKM F-4519 (FW-2642)]|nr:hypothetical protein V501_01618 [Pseudogymnoascus sp. VKM F-4519 (FW-2642)]